MEFLYPTFLWSLLALAIPVIIHLFYFRRFKKVPFTNVKFLKEIKEETSHRSRIRNLLVLLSRIIALGALILAFAYPFFKDSSDSIVGRKASSIFIDNSFSMQSKAEDVILLEKAKASARQVIESHRDDDLIQILTHDLEGRHQRWMSKEDALGIIDEIKTSSASHSLSTILQRQKQLFPQAEGYAHQIYWLSDFQEKMMNVTSISDTSFRINFMPFQSVEENNISLDSVWMESPIAQANESNPIHVKLKNHSNGDVENVRVTVKYDNQVKPLTVVDLKAGESLVDTFSMSIQGSGWQSAKFQITDHPITFDDAYHITFEVPDRLQILILTDQTANPLLSKAVKSFPEMDLAVQAVNSVNYSKLSDFDLIVLDEVRAITSGLSTELSNYQSAGGNVLFFPSANGDLISYNQFLSSLGGPQLSKKEEDQREVSRINSDEFVFNDVFFRITRNIRLPQTQISYPVGRSSSGSAERLLTYRDGGIFLGKYTRDEGRLFVCAAPLQKSVSSLAQNAEIFIPMLYKMALSRNTKSQTSYVIGQDEVIEIPKKNTNSESIYEVQGAETFIPGVRHLGKKTLISIEGQIKNDGIYSLQNEKKEVRKLAFNYSRDESSMSYQKVNQDWASQFQPGSRVISGVSQTNLASFLEEEREGKSYWRTLLILSLIFLGIEQLLLRFWKT